MSTSSVTTDVGHGNHHQPSETSHSSQPIRDNVTFDGHNIPNRPYVRYVTRDDWQKPRDIYEEPFYDRFSRPNFPPVRFKPDRSHQRLFESYQDELASTQATINLLEKNIRSYETELARRGAEGFELQRDHLELTRKWQEELDFMERKKLFLSKRINNEIERPLRDYVMVSKGRDEPRHLPGIFQTIFDVNHPQDATVHLEFPITDDLETELEAFSRLRRLGNFSAAQEYFNKRLMPYSNDPYVFIHFGEMLLDQGDYITLKGLDPKSVFGEEMRSLRMKMRVDESGKKVPSLVVTTVNRSRARDHEKEYESAAHTRNQVAGGSPVRRPSGRFEYSQSIRRDKSSPDSPERLATIEKIDYLELDQDHGSDSGDSSNWRRAESDMMTNPQIGCDGLELLRQNWRLLEAIYTITIQPGPRSKEYAIAEVWYTIAKFQFGISGIGSTEIQILALTLQLLSRIHGLEVSEADYTLLQKAAEEWIDWSALVKELHVQGRIWDFNDIYFSALAAFHDRADELFSGTGDTKLSLVDDWGTGVEEEDESTNLAQLSLLVETNRFPKEAQTRAEAIMAHFPAAMKSGPFLRWILDNAVYTLEGEDVPNLAYITHLEGFSGMISYGTWVLPALYIPRKSENPGWVMPFRSPSPRATESLLLALNLAKELGSYKLEAQCYRLLIHQSQDPEEFFKELADLQKFRMGLGWSHLEALLSSYLVCRDRQAKERLIEELHQTYDWGQPVGLYLARDFIERALKRSLEGPKSTVRLRHPASFYRDKELHENAEQFIRYNADPEEILSPPPPPPSQIPPEPVILRRPVPPAFPRSPPPGSGYAPPASERWHNPAVLKEWQRYEREEGKIESGSEWEITSTYTEEEGYGDGRVESPFRAKTEKSRAFEHEKEGQDRKIKNRPPQQKTRDRSEREESLQGRLHNRGEQGGQSRRKQEVHFHHGDDVDDTQKHSYTDLVLYKGPRSTQTPEQNVARSSLLRSHKSPVSLNLHVAEIQDQNKPRPRQEDIKTANGKEPGKDEVLAKEQEQLNQFGRYGRQRSPIRDSTGIWDAFEEINKKKARKRTVKDPPPSPHSTPHPVARPGRPGPSFTQQPDGIKHPERRTSWRDKTDRAETPTRLPSVNVDADGRVQPVRTTSEPGRSYVGHAASGIRIRSKGGDGVQGGPSVSRISSIAAGKRPQRPSGSPSYSGKDMGSRLRRPGPRSSAQEDVDERKLGRESDGSLRRKKAMSTLREDSEKGNESMTSHPDTPSKAGESPKPQASLDPEPGLSRRPTVTDPELGEE